MQVEIRKLELECRVLELKQILLQHNVVDDIQKLNGCPWIFYNQPLCEQYVTVCMCTTKKT